MAGDSTLRGSSHRLGPSLVGALVALSGVWACSRSGVGCGAEAPALASGSASSAPVSSASAGPEAAASGSAPTPPLDDDWAQAVREGRVADAERLIAALPETDRRRPAMRYLRARLALQAERPKDAAALLEGLEEKLPALAADIRRRRARAWLATGQGERALPALKKGKSARARLQTARALAESGDPKGALAETGRALAALPRKGRARRRARRTEAMIRRFRAELAEQLKKVGLARGEWRWLATVTPTRSEARGADDALARLSPARPLTTAERRQRLEAFARSGDATATDAELAALAKLPGGKVPAAEALKQRGRARYNGRDYTEAARLFDEAVKLGGSPAPYSAFLAARALSRVHRDDEARQRYESVARKYPASAYAQRATYLAARLRWIDGDFPGAIDAYDAYLKKYRRGRHVESSRYERAIALIATERGKAALVAAQKLHGSTRSSRRKARYLQLIGVAQLALGKQDDAATTFRQVLRRRPLSAPALFAAARLKQLGKAPGRLIPPATKAQRAPHEALKPTLPPTVQLLTSLGLDRDAERLLARQSSRVKAAHEDRESEAMCAAFGLLEPAAQRYRVGQRVARWSTLAHAVGPSSRWIWECVYPTPYSALTARLEKEYRLPTGLLHAVMRQESGFRGAVNSPVGAVGLMQIMPSTGRHIASELEVELPDDGLTRPVIALRFGAYYLRRLLDAFDDQVPLAVAGYNAGPSAVLRWLKGGQKLPLDVFVARIPYGETRNYVYRVLGNLARYAYLRGGSDEVERIATFPLELRPPTGGKGLY